MRDNDMDRENDMEWNRIKVYYFFPCITSNGERIALKK